MDLEQTSTQLATRHKRRVRFWVAYGHRLNPPLYRSFATLAQPLRLRYPSTYTTVENRDLG
jgi:hypothetical protein